MFQQAVLKTPEKVLQEHIELVTANANPAIAEALQMTIQKQLNQKIADLFYKPKPKEEEKIEIKYVESKKKEPKNRQKEEAKTDHKKQPQKPETPLFKTD